MFNIFSNFFLSKKSKSPTDDFWYNEQPRLNKSYINEDNALSISAVYAAVTAIAETVATLPIKIYSKDRNSNKVERPDIDLWKLFRETPNGLMTSFDFWKAYVSSIALRGVGYARIYYSKSTGRINSLEFLHPDQVTPKIISNKVKYSINYYNENLKLDHKVTLSRSDLFVTFDYTNDGIIPISRIKLCRESLEHSLDLQNFGNNYFKSGAKPSGILTTENKIGAEAKKIISNEWRKQFSGSENAGKTAIVDQGLKYSSISLSNEDSQYLESKRFQIEEIARIFRVPPHIIQDLTRSTFSNIEHQSLEFVQHTINPWLTKIENSIKMQLIISDKLFAEFIVDGLLRGDSKTRTEKYNSGITNGWMTRNEARKLENLPPLKGLDNPLVPLNMAEEGSNNNNNDYKAAIKPFLEDISTRISSAFVKESLKKMYINSDSLTKYALKALTPINSKELAKEINEYILNKANEFNFLEKEVKEKSAAYLLDQQVIKTEILNILEKNYEQVN